MRPRFSIFGNHTIILVDSNVIQGDSYYIDHSQTTRNQDSFNIENTTFSRQMIPLDSGTFSVPRKSGTSSKRHDADTPSGERDKLSKLPSGSRAARTAAVPMQCTSEVEVLFNKTYPPSVPPPLFNQAFQSQHATCSSPNISYVSHSTASIGTGMAMRDSAEITPTSQGIYEYICGKIKEWYDQAFNYLFTRR